MRINKPLLRKTMEKIEEIPDHRTETSSEYWNQRHWIVDFYNGENEVCGTAACFAGWATILNGAEYLDYTVYLTQQDMADHPEMVKHHAYLGGGIHVRYYAQMVLGLTGEVADDLFYCKNTREQLREKVDQLLESNV